MASIYLLLQSKKSPAVIYIRLRDGRTLDIKAKTNFHIDPINWDDAEQRPTKKALKDIDIPLVVVGKKTKYFNKVNKEIKNLSEEQYSIKVRTLVKDSILLRILNSKSTIFIN